MCTPKSCKPFPPPGKRRFLPLTPATLRSIVLICSIRGSLLPSLLLSITAMNFLVTGGAGFIGSNLSERLLSEGHEVTAFDDLNDFYNPARKERNLAELAKFPKFHFVKGDLRD